MTDPAFVARLRGIALGAMLPDWAPMAACAEKAPNQHPWEVMFADDGIGRRSDGRYAWPPKVLHAIGVCRTCPVRPACLRYALEAERHEEQDYWAADLTVTTDGVRSGIYGGVPGVIRTERRDAPDPFVACDAWFQEHFGTPHLDDSVRVNA